MEAVVLITWHGMYPNFKLKRNTFRLSVMISLSKYESVSAYVQSNFDNEFAH